MEIVVKLMYMFFDLVLPLSVGYLCRSRSWGSEVFFRRLIDAGLWVIYPALSVLTFWVLSLNYELIWLPIFGIMLSVIPGAVAYLRIRNKYANELDKGSYIICAMLSNIGTLGGLCAFIVYGEVGFAYTQLVVLLQNFVVFMFCFPLAQYYYQKSIQQEIKKQSLAALFFSRNQLPIVGIAIGIFLKLIDVPRPDIASQMVNPLVHMGAWAALVPLGHSIDFTAMRKYYTGILDLVPIKFIVTPVVAYLLAKMVITDQIALNTLLILATMPTAINAVLAVKIHNLNLNIAMAAFILTTVVFLVAELPILFLWLNFVR